jgi:hypothetical protein
VTSTWQDSLQLQRNYRNFQNVLTQDGTAIFPPGLSTIGGDFCYDPPYNATGLRHLFKLTGAPARCQTERKSPSIDPCPVQPVCTQPPGGPVAPTSPWEALP